MAIFPGPAWGSLLSSIEAMVIGHLFHQVMAGRSAFGGSRSWTGCLGVGMVETLEYTRISWTEGQLGEVFGMARNLWVIGMSGSVMGER